MSIIPNRSFLFKSCFRQDHTDIPGCVEFCKSYKSLQVTKKFTESKFSVKRTNTTSYNS